MASAMMECMEFWENGLFSSIYAGADFRLLTKNTGMLYITT
jgi:hypothetical protein